MFPSVAGLGVGVGVAPGVGVGVHNGQGVGVGANCAQYLPPLLKPTPPQTIISLPVQTAA